MDGLYEEESQTFLTSLMLSSLREKDIQWPWPTAEPSLERINLKSSLA